LRSLIVGRLCDIALDGVHLFCLHAGGSPVHLGLELLNHFVVLDDGLVQGRHKLFQMRQVGLDVYQPFFMRHGCRVPQAGQGIDSGGRASFNAT